MPQKRKRANDTYDIHLLLIEATDEKYKIFTHVANNMMTAQMGCQSTNYFITGKKLVNSKQLEQNLQHEATKSASSILVTSRHKVIWRRPH